MGKRLAAGVVLGKSGVGGDGRGQSVLVAQPHAAKALPQRGSAVDQAVEVIEAWVGADLPGALVAQQVAQRLGDGLPGGALADSGDERGLAFGVLVEDQR